MTGHFNLELATSTPVISTLPSVSIPSFSVITGDNGVGKTVLMRAIEAKSIRLSSTLNGELLEAFYFNLENFAPGPSKTYSVSDIEKRAGSVLEHQLGTILSDCSNQFYSDLKDLGIDCNSFEQFQILDASAKTSSELQDALNSLGQKVASHSKKTVYTDLRSIVESLILETPELCLQPSILHQRLTEEIAPNKGPLDNELAAIFGSYRTKKQHTAIRALKSQEKPPENDLEKPPWDNFNEIMSRNGLPFSVSSLDISSREDFTVQLLREGEPIDYSHLSSGETIIIKLFTILYKLELELEQFENPDTKLPKVLLLDEIDSPLHPHMVEKFIKVLTEEFIEKRGFSVILSTHSPTTVALSPPDSIFILKNEASSHSLTPVSQREALSLLTESIPHLHISFDDVRTVFVEGSGDAPIYTELFKLYWTHLNPKIQLNFISVSSNDGENEIDGGSDRVIGIVESLSNNPLVFGLVDYDNGSSLADKETPMIIALSPNKRYSIESLLLDPVLLATTIVRLSQTKAASFGICNEDETYSDLKDWPTDRWKEAVKIVQKRVLELEGDPEEDLDIGYLNGMDLKLDKRFLLMKGHELENKVRKAYPLLSKLDHTTSDNLGLKITGYIAKTILSENYRLVPIDLIETFQTIQSTKSTH